MRISSIERRSLAVRHDCAHRAGSFAARLFDARIATPAVQHRDLYDDRGLYTDRASDRAERPMNGASE